MPELEQAPALTEVEGTAKAERWFNRFTREQRYLHAVLFSTFLGLAGTGLPLRFSESIWARGLAGPSADSEPSSSFTSFAHWC